MTADPVDIDLSSEKGQREALAHLTSSLDLLTRNSAIWARLPDMYVDLWDDAEVLEGCCQEAVRLKRTVDEIAQRIPHARDEADFVQCQAAIIRANDKGKATFLSKMFSGLHDRDSVYQEKGLNFFAGLLVGYGDICARLEGIFGKAQDYALPADAFAELRNLHSQCRAKSAELKALRDGMIARRDFTAFPKPVAERHAGLWKRTQKFIEDAMTHHILETALRKKGGAG